MLTLAVVVWWFAACGPATSPLVPVTGPTAAPPLAATPLPTPGARVRLANVGDYILKFAALQMPRELVRFGDVPSNSITDYVATVHGAYEQVGLVFGIDDVIFGPNPPQGPPFLPAPIAGYAFTYYVVLETDDTGLPRARTLRITRDE